MCWLPKVFFKSEPSGSQTPLQPAVNKNMNSLVLLEYDCDRGMAEVELPGI